MQRTTKQHKQCDGETMQTIQWRVTSYNIYNTILKCCKNGNKL
jgi:hypothetical protein